MIVNVYGKKVPISDTLVEIYDGIYPDKFTDLTAQYMAGSYECEEETNPSVEEIARAVERNILEHTLLYFGAFQDGINKWELKVHLH